MRRFSSWTQDTLRQRRTSSKSPPQSGSFLMRTRLAARAEKLQQPEGNRNEENHMERRRFLGALTAASLGVALEGQFNEVAAAQNAARSGSGTPGLTAKGREFPENSTIVLVHGAWADGYCWSNIILPLERRGLRVICAPLPLTSLTNDATALSWALAQTSG